MSDLKTERELDTIRGKMLVAAATPEELQDFLRFVAALEQIVDEADGDDYFGTEGWRHRIGVT